MSVERLQAEADRLAGDGEWGPLAELLSSAGRETILRRPTLAYRFGEALYHTGRLQELDGFAREFEEAAREAADMAGTLRALNLSFTAAFETGDIGRARDRAERLLELAHAEDDREMQARAANNLGLVHNLQGNPEEALRCYEMAIPLYDALGQKRGLAQTYHNRGISYRDLGRLDDAVKSFRRAADLAEEIGYEFLSVMTVVSRAEVELRRGDEQYAAGLAERGVENARQVGDPVTEAEALRVRALVHADGGSPVPEYAARDLERAEDLARETGASLLLAEIQRDKGRLLGKEGRVEEARDHLESAAHLFASLGALELEREVDEQLAAL